MKISLELVPRLEEQLLEETKLAIMKYKSITNINIPDLLSLKMRSWEASGLMVRGMKDEGIEKLPVVIPHIRAMDFNMKKLDKLYAAIEENKLTELLVLTGDLPQRTHYIHPTTSVELIAQLKKDFKGIKIYGAIDQYRGSIKSEYEYVKKKMDVGADGFFTQPFFDIRFIEIYAEILEDTEMFWGISPIITQRSMDYWTTRNNVIFPKEFEPNLEYNCNFAKRVIEFAMQSGGNIYFMPIKVNVDEYLKGVLGMA